MFKFSNLVDFSPAFTLKKENRVDLNWQSSIMWLNGKAFAIHVWHIHIFAVKDPLTQEEWHKFPHEHWYLDWFLLTGFKHTLHGSILIQTKQTSKTYKTIREL